MHPRPLVLLAIAAVALLGTGGRASAGMICYNKGQDDNIGPASPLSARVNTNAGLAAFSNDVGTFSTITFDGLKTGPFTNSSSTRLPASAVIDVGQGAKALLTSVDPSPPVADAKGSYAYGVTADHGGNTLGFNTSTNAAGNAAVGSQFLRFVPFLQNSPADLTIQFGSVVKAFGLTISGLGGAANGQLHVLFNTGGVPQDILLKGTAKGGVRFFGVSNLPTAVSSFTLEMRGVSATSRDIISIDDVRFLAVPEPSSMALLGLGVFTLGVASRRGRRRSA
jgi:hypothetical protein